MELNYGQCGSENAGKLTHVLARPISSSRSQLHGDPPSGRGWGCGIPPVDDGQIPNPC
jgi:hypothetical protein